jgi:dipeptidyl aminopeptidase/acylaminoacyl peptidase
MVVNMKEIPVSFESEGQKVVGDLYIPSEETLSSIILTPGFSGWKSAPHNIHLARKLCERGFMVFTFGFRGFGESEGKPEDITITRHVKDLKKAVDYVKNQKYMKVNKIGILSRSYSGLVSIILAAKDKRINALVTFASISNPIFDDKMRKSLEEKGFYQYSSFVRLTKKFLNDSRKYRNSSINFIKKVSIPWLIIHGDKDDVVDISVANKLYKYAVQPKKLIIIKNLGHFLRESKEVQNQLISLSSDWFNKWLK